MVRRRQIKSSGRTADRRSRPPKRPAAPRTPAHRAGGGPRGGWVVGREIARRGGTGKEGGGLAVRWAAKGHEVILGSRSAERAESAAAELNRLLGGRGTLRGAGNREAAQAAGVVILCV